MPARASDLSLGEVGAAADELRAGTCAGRPAEIEKCKQAVGGWSFCAGILDVLLPTFSVGSASDRRRRNDERQLNGRDGPIAGEEWSE